MQVQTAVVGGGVTGLTAAHALVKAGREVRLFEAAPVLGGAVQTLFEDGFTLEQGPFTVMLRAPEAMAQIQELALEPLEIDAGAAKNRYVFWDGQLRAAPSSLGSFLSSSLLSGSGKAAVMAGLFRSPPRTSGRDETIWEVAKRRAGRETADRLAAAGAVGVFAAEAKELSFDACIPVMAAPDREAGSIVGMMRRLKAQRKPAAPGAPPRPKRTMISFEGGLGALVQALAEPLGDAAARNARVECIERADHGFRLTINGELVYAESVVTAATAPATARLAANVAPEAARLLDEIPAATLGVVHFGFRKEDVAHSLDGFGFLIPPSAPVEPLLGVLWASSIFPGQAPPGTTLLRCVVGGTRYPAVAELAQAELEAQSLAAISPLLGIRGEPILTQSRVWPQSVPVYAPGHLDRVARIHQALEPAGALRCLGNWTGGLGVNDRIRTARQWAHGTG